MIEDPRREDPGRGRTKRRLGIWVRLAIYVPALGFFGWRAWERFANEREAADEVFRERVGQWLANPPQTIMLPNGEALPMLTPEQAAAHGYQLPASVLEDDPEAPAEPSPTPAAEAEPEPSPEPRPEPSLDPTPYQVPPTR